MDLFLTSKTQTVVGNDNMSIQNEIEKYEQLPKELIGQSIVKVEYIELPFAEEESYKHEHYHSLDYGVQILTNENNYYYFIWDSQKTQFDLKFSKGHLVNELNP